MRAEAPPSPGVVVTGVVTAAESYTDSTDGIRRTLSTITVDQVAGGTAPATVTIETLGGKLPDGRVVVASDVPQAPKVGARARARLGRAVATRRSRRLARVGSVETSAVFSAAEVASEARAVDGNCGYDPGGVGPPNGRWARMPHTWQVNEYGRPPSIPSGYTLAAVAAASGTWNNDPLSWVNLGATANGGAVMNADDGVNSVVWGETAGSVVAYTMWTYGPNGLLSDTDILLGKTKPFVIGTAQDSYDLESVVLHEVGHAVGQNHTLTRGETMYPCATANALARSLTGEAITNLRNWYDVNAAGDLVSVTQSGDTLRVKGWAMDFDSPDNPVMMALSYDGFPSGNFSAGAYNTAVPAAFPGQGNYHGLDISMPTNGGTHQVCAVALNVGTGQNGQVSCKSATATVSPQGAVSDVFDQYGKIRVYGWALDPSNLAQSITVDVLVDGVTKATVTAQSWRLDLPQTWGSTGYAHGVDVSLPATVGAHTVCLNGRNIGAGANRQVGCKTMNVLPDPFTAAPQGRFVPREERLLDTREAGGAIGAGGTRVLTLRGTHGIPANATAVAVNVTAFGPTQATHLTAYPSGTARPQTSTVNASAGQVVANGAVVGIGPSGALEVYNNSGSTHVIVDLLGWFEPVATGGKGLRPLAPRRVWDTRARGWVLGRSGQDIDIPIGGVAGIPTSGVEAVALNITIAGATRASHLVVYPSGQATPATSTMNFGAGDTRAGNVVVGLGNNSSVHVRNNVGEVHVVVDVVGWFGSGTGKTFTAVAPSRLLDTRSGHGPVLAGAPVDVVVAGVGGIPATGVRGVTVTIAAVDAATNGHLQAYASGTPAPVPSILNFTGGGGKAVANHVFVPVGADGKIRLEAPIGGSNPQVLVDVTGWTS